MLVVIGCGNPNRSDDGAGSVVVQKVSDFLVRHPNPHVQVFDSGTDGMGVMFKARGATSLIIVDASQTGSDAGAIYEVPGEELQGKPPHSMNLHDFRWDHALFAGQQIFSQDFPKDVTVYLIEAGNLSLGLELSPLVAKSVDRVAEKVIARIESYAP